MEIYANYSQCQCRSAPVNILFGSNTFTGRNRPYNHTAIGEFCKQSVYQIGRNKWPFAFFSNNFLSVLTCGFFRRLALPRAARLIRRSALLPFLTQKKKVSFLNASHIISFQLQYQWQKFIHACRTEVNWVSLVPKQQVKWYIPDLEYRSVHDEYTFVIYSYGSKITFSSRKCILYKRYIWCTLKDWKIERNVEN